MSASGSSGLRGASSPTKDPTSSAMPERLAIALELREDQMRARRRATLPSSWRIQLSETAAIAAKAEMRSLRA